MGVGVGVGEDAITHICNMHTCHSRKYSQLVNTSTFLDNHWGNSLASFDVFLGLDDKAL